jgi:hypothetical protein
MEVTFRRIALFLCVLALLLTTPRASFADPKPEDMAEARDRYKKGLELYEEGAFDAALTELQRAYDIAPSYKILYNLGLVYTQLNDFAGALRSFRKYLNDGGKKIDAKRRSDVEKEITKLEKRVATIELAVNVAGADVAVDDLDVGQTPLEAPLIVNAGKRKISVRKDGYQPFVKVLVVAGADKKPLDVVLEPGTEAPPGPAPGGKVGKKTKPEKPPEPSSRVPWLWWGITGGLAAGTAVTGVLTLGAQKDLDDKKAKPATKQSLDDAASKTRTLAIVTDVLLVGTVAVGSYATYLTFFKKETRDPRADKKSSLDLRIGPGSVAFGGTF